MEKYIYLKFDQNTGKTNIDRVCEEPVLFNPSIPQDNIRLYSNIKISGADLDVEFILSKLFPEDDPTLDIIHEI